MEIGPPELIIVLIVVLLIFGPGRIAKVGRELGAGIRQFREGLHTPPPEQGQTDSDTIESSGDGS